jgi:hypothetical protein
MTQTVELPNGDTIEFPDNMSEDGINAAVSRHMAATSTNFAGMSPHLDEKGAPEYLDQGAAAVAPGDKLAARTAMRANPLLAIPNAAFVGTQMGMNAISNKLGGPTKDVFNPLESGIDKLGLGMDPDAGTAMRTADSLLPWLAPTGNQIGRVAEAPGMFNKAATLGRSEVANATNWFLSGEAQKWAAEHGYGPLAQMIAGMVGGNATTILGRPAAKAVPLVVPPKEGAGGTIEANKALLPPPGSSTSTLPPLKDVADPNSSIASFIAGSSALPLSGTGERGAVKTQTEAIANTANAGLQKLDPTVTPVQRAGPSSLQATASRLADEAQQKILTAENELKARSDAIEAPIKNSKIDGTALWSIATQLSEDKGAGADVQEAAKRALANIETSLNPDGTISFNAAKNNRSGLKKIINDMFPASTGDATGKREVGKGIRPILNAYTAAMQDAADRGGVGSEWSKLDADWGAHAEMKDNLEATGGKLVRAGDKPKFDPSPGGAGVSNTLTKAVAGEGRQGTAPIQNIEEGLGEAQARKGVAETISSMAQPKAARTQQDFRPSLWGQGEKARVDPAIMDWIERKAGSGARQNIDNAAEAAARTSESNREGGWKKAFGSVLGASTTLGATGGALGIPGMMAAAPFMPLLTTAAHDPDFIRAVAGKSIPLTDPSMMTQIGTHAALGGAPLRSDPMEGVRYGAGQALNAANAGFSKAVESIPAVLAWLARLKAESSGPASKHP